MSWKRHSLRAFESARKTVWHVVVLVVGSGLLLAGIAMIVLPGPAFVFIPAGLAVLATQYVWAKRLLHYLRSQLPGQNSSAEPDRQVEKNQPAGPGSSPGAALEPSSEPPGDAAEPAVPERLLPPEPDVDPVAVSDLAVDDRREQSGQPS